jgi:hypothetical protein
MRQKFRQWRNQVAPVARFYRDVGVVIWQRRSFYLPRITAALIPTVVFLVYLVWFGEVSVPTLITAAILGGLSLVTLAMIAVSAPVELLAAKDQEIVRARQQADAERAALEVELTEARAQRDEAAMREGCRAVVRQAIERIEYEMAEWERQRRREVNTGLAPGPRELVEAIDDQMQHVEAALRGSGRFEGIANQLTSQRVSLEPADVDGALGQARGAVNRLRDLLVQNIFEDAAR